MHRSDGYQLEPARQTERERERAREREGEESEEKVDSRSSFLYHNDVIATNPGETAA
jgi:hypothetical protein